MWRLLLADQRRAHKRCPGSRAFSSLDFARVELLVSYMPPDAVGGRLTLPGGDNLSGDHDNTQLAALGRVLKAAICKPRFLRSIDQWHASFPGVAPVAVCTGQWSQVDVQSYRDQFNQFVVKAKVEGVSPFVPLLHDILHRTNLVRHWRRADSSLDISFELRTADKATWDAAKDRIGMFLQQVEVDTNGSTAVTSSSGAGTHMGSMQVATEEFREQAQEAGQALARQQQEFIKQQNDFMRQFQQPWKPDICTTGGKSGGKPKKKQKQAAYVAWARGVKKNNAKGQQWQKGKLQSGGE